jgi:hypothetical protein
MDIVVAEELWRDSLLFFIESDLSLVGIYVRLAVLISTKYEIRTNACRQDTFRASD